MGYDELKAEKIKRQAEYAHHALTSKDHYVIRTTSAVVRRSKIKLTEPIMINRQLAESRKLPEINMILIEQAQEFRKSITVEIAEQAKSHTDKIVSGLVGDADSITILLDKWRDNEFKLQRLWGFEENSAYHREFMIDGCTCPKSDNEELVGTNRRIYSDTCVIHQAKVRKYNESI